MKYLFFLVIVLATASCQINVMQPLDSGDTIIPDASARIARKLSIGGPDGKTLYGEDRYEYNADSQLTRLNRLYRNGSGQMELYSYDEHKYSGQQLQELTSYSFMQGKPYITSVRRYEYPMPNKIIEQTYAVNSKSELTMVTSRTETILEQGQKARVIQYYRNNQTFEKSRETVYRYEAGRLVAEEILNPNGIGGTVFRYGYKGRTGKVEEFMANRPESISEQLFQYDSRGRLTRSEVLKVNPLLCVAMVSGSATVYEYVD